MSTLQEYYDKGLNNLSGAIDLYAKYEEARQGAGAGATSYQAAVKPSIDTEPTGGDVSYAPQGGAIFGINKTVAIVGGIAAVGLVVFFATRK